MAIKTQLGTQRYNNRMDKIWESAQKAIKETEAKREIEEITERIKKSMVEQSIAAFNLRT